MPDPGRHPESLGLPEAVLDLALARLVDVPPAEQAVALEDLCRAHVPHADGLRRLARQLSGAEAVLHTSFPALSPEDPDTIGPFRVERRLGQGAFGVVYLCAQTAPIQRRVAIKVLRPGAGDRSTLQRFEAERQVLALMGHPAIANVLDAGAMPDGRPYFVMEHVAGAPITSWCDQERLGLEQRLQLFLLLCEGVQHAHVRGIIHRDLKPSNVLVVTIEGRPQPKIIDFGLAKALHLPAAGGEQATESGRVLGTPGYMSPEQAEGRHHEVDTRTDVFALGVILYEILSGVLPWERGSRGTGSEPLRPSARLLPRSAQASAVAQHRASEPRRLKSQLRGDLDWIVLKALSLERELRYQSPLELAEDLQRHLRHEPVRAGRPSTVYVLRKFMRRHRLPVLAAGAVLVSLCAALVVSIWFAAQARTSLQRFEILAIGKRLERARSPAVSLFPAWPERAADMDRWLHEHGEPAQRELPRLQQALADMRAQALAYTDAAGAEDRQRHPLAQEIASKRETIVYLETLLADATLAESRFGSTRTMMEERLGNLRQELPVLVARQGEQRTWRFASDEQQFVHDTLAQLCQDLAAFASGEACTVERVRRARAAIVAGERSMVEQRARWDAVAAELEADPRFVGFHLRPQFGLVPLGRDPVSGLQEFYHESSGWQELGVPQRGGDGRLALEEGSGIVLVLLPGGRQLIGAQREDANGPCYDPRAQIGESPVRELELVPFFLGKHELTQAQWMLLGSSGTNPSHIAPGSVIKGGVRITRRHPVESVTWDECVLALERNGLELPTEAQWEHGCRAGTTTIWPTGDTVASLRGFANLSDTTADAHDGSGGDEPLADGYAVHAPVGSFAGNAFGLCDMIGNVSEWCRDSFSSLAYLLQPRAGDGLRPVPAMQVRPTRGGSFDDLPLRATSAARASPRHDARFNYVGVRAARSVQR